MTEPAGMGITSKESSVRTVTLAVDGRLDALEAPALRAAIGVELAVGPTCLIIDLSHTDFVDSAGLAALVKGLKDAKEGGGDLRIVRPGADDAMRVFRLTRFDEVFTMCETPEMAVRGW